MTLAIKQYFMDKQGRICSQMVVKDEDEDTRNVMLAMCNLALSTPRPHLLRCAEVVCEASIVTCCLCLQHQYLAPFTFHPGNLNLRKSEKETI